MGDSLTSVCAQNLAGGSWSPGRAEELPGSQLPPENIVCHLLKGVLAKVEGLVYCSTPAFLRSGCLACQQPFALVIWAFIGSICRNLGPSSL